MLLPNGSSRRRKNIKQSNHSMRIESLEHRRMLTGDGILPDVESDDFIPAAALVSGTKWEDFNGDGRRGPDDVGLGGVTIYADANGNERLDEGERWTTTREDDPDTRVDEAGTYDMWLDAGAYTIREIVPEGYAQTFPVSNPIFVDPEPFNGSIVAPSAIEIEFDPDVIQQTVTFIHAGACDRPLELDIQAIGADGSPEDRVEVSNLSGLQINACNFEPSVFELEMFVPDSDVTYFELGIVDIIGQDVIATIPVSVAGGTSDGGHDVRVDVGTRIAGLDFGNTRVDGSSGSIEGRTWRDQNGNGQQDPNEVGLGGVEVYLDTNNNGELDRGEPSTRSLFEDPYTDFDEGGLYSFGDLRPGSYTVREVVPNSYVQTFPTVEGDVIESETGRFQAGSALDFDLVNVSYDQSGGTPETTVTLLVQWPNGCGFVDAGQTSHAVIGDTILVNAHGGLSGEICTEALIETEVEVSIPNLEPGIYSVAGTLHEGSGATLGMVGEFEIGVTGAHFVELAANDIASGFDFGNRQTSRTESISGFKWNDQNGDGAFQRNEVGLGGVTIYVDTNRNGQLDEGEISTVTSSDRDSLGTYQLVGVQPGIHEIREVVPEGYQQTFPHVGFNLPVDLPFEDLIPFPSEGSHLVELFPGDQIESVNFGNQSTEPGSVSGTKWNDANGNTIRDEGEEGLANVTIYVDINGNGALDENEPSSVSNESGEYKIDGVRPGTYQVREIVPDGYIQTFPGNDFLFVEPLQGEATADLLWRPFFQHYITFSPGEVVEGIDFGNQRIELGSISGIKWNDVNGNGIREPEEAALAGVTIFIDQNFNGVFNPGEPSTVTATDNPDTVEDETGRYRFGNLQPFNTYYIREVVPEGYEQTFPAQFDWPSPFEGVDDPDIIDLILPTGQHNIYVSSGQDIEQVNFGNREIPEPGFVSGVVWEDANGDGIRDENESGYADVQVFVDSNLNGRYDRNETITTTQSDDPDTEADETGEYTLKVQPGFHLILQSNPRRFQQTSPDPSRELIFPFNLGHSVTVEAGVSVDGLNFGGVAISDSAPVDSEMGDDPHSDLHDESATLIEFHEGHAQLNSYVDTDDDQDVFRFVGNGSVITGEGGTVDGGGLILEFLDGTGNTISVGGAGEMISTDTEEGETYFVRVSGTQGRYQLDLLEESITPETTTLPGDTDGDGDVDFRDFLVLSNNFGNAVDAAMAEADFDGDGQVSFADFLVLSQNFGSSL